MNRKIILSVFVASVMLFTVACNSGNQSKENTSTTTPADNSSAAANESTNPKGIGPHQNIQLTHPLDEKMVSDGQNIYNLKCASCHKTTDEKLVGPGWKGVTSRRTPEWIMNFVTNTEEMLAKDTAAKNLLEICLVKMPNQNLQENDARSILEFMRKNDSEK